jgi:hypothetical protein
MRSAFTIFGRIVSTILGRALIFLGIVWILQAYNIAFNTPMVAGGPVSFMVNNHQWAAYGTIAIFDTPWLFLSLIPGGIGLSCSCIGGSTDGGGNGPRGAADCVPVFNAQRLLADCHRRAVAVAGTPSGHGGPEMPESRRPTDSRTSCTLHRNSLRSTAR